jgi:hypothetical protein
MDRLRVKDDDESFTGTKLVFFLIVRGKSMGSSGLEEIGGASEEGVPPDVLDDMALEGMDCPMGRSTLIGGGRGLRFIWEQGNIRSSSIIYRTIRTKRSVITLSENLLRERHHASSLGELPVKKSSDQK